MNRPSNLFLLCLLGSGAVWVARGQQGTYTDQGSLLEICEQPSPLPADLFDCAVNENINMGDVHQYFLDVPRDAAFNLDVQLRSISGDADIVVIGPNSTVQWTSDERVGEDVVSIPMRILQQNPGRYYIQILGYQTYSSYQLSIQTPGRPSLLVKEEVTLLEGVFNKCCAPEDYTMSSTCMKLQAAIQPNRTVAQDLCSQPPNVCDPSGHLVKLVLAGDSTGNLACNNGGNSPASFPEEFGGFTYLEVLDLSYNILIGNLTKVAETLQQLPRLRRLFLMRNNIGGPFDCSIITPKLEVLWLKGNVMTGALPECTFASPRLQQLSLAGNLLSGQLPNLPRSSPLVLLDVGANGPPDGPGIGGTGLTGTLPASIVNAKNLLHLDISSNSLTGTLPPLPLSLEAFLANDNLLEGGLPESLFASEELRLLRVARNRLSGTLSHKVAGLDALVSLQLQDNDMEGAINFRWDNDFLHDIDLSNNRFSGSFPEWLGDLNNLRIIKLSNNSLTGNLQAFGNRLRSNNMVSAFNVTANKLIGGIPPSLQALRLFNALPISNQDGPVDETDWNPVSRTEPAAFDVSNNKMAGDYPMWMLNSLQNLQALQTSNSSQLQVRMLGGSNSFRCPQPVTSVSQLPQGMVGLQSSYNLSCSDRTTNNTITVYTALTMAPKSSPPQAGGGSGVGSGSGSPATGGGAGSGTIPGSQSPNRTVIIGSGGSKKSGSNVAAIGGAAGGGVVGLLVIGGAVWYVRRRAQARKFGSRSRRTPLTYNQAFDQTGREYEDDNDDDKRSDGASTYASAASGRPMMMPLKSSGYNPHPPKTSMNTSHYAGSRAGKGSLAGSVNGDGNTPSTTYSMSPRPPGAPAAILHDRSGSVQVYDRAGVIMHQGPGSVTHDSHLGGAGEMMWRNPMFQGGSSRRH